MLAVWKHQFFPSSTLVMAIRVIQFGLGPIGSAAARHVHERAGLELVGGVDIDPKKMGHDLGNVIGLGRPLGLSVYGSLAELLKETTGDVVLHTTSSYFDLFKPQLIEILESGLDVVSTAEELSFPWLANAAEAHVINDAALRTGKTVLGTGVNPGFLMDTLPLTITGICQRVDHLSITRVINASERRGPFQAKIGAGMSVDAFMAKMEAGRMGHVGLPESIGMLFYTLGVRLDRYEDVVEPLVAAEPIHTEYFRVDPGQVMGLKQVARAFGPEGEFAVLTFIAALGMEEDGDTIVIKGKPDLKVHLKGTNGDYSTVAIAVNAIRRVHEAPPGLATMRDLPAVTFFY